MAFDIQKSLDAGATLAQINAALAKEKKFNLAGALNAGFSDTAIFEHLNPAAPVQKAPAGFLESIKNSSFGLGSKEEAAFATAKTPEELAAARQAFIAAEAPTGGRQVGLSDVQGVGDFLDFFKQTAGSSIGFLAAPLAAGAATAATGVGAPAAPYVVGATLAAQYTKDNLLRQAREQQAAIDAGKAPEETSVGKALGAAAGSTALDVVGLRFFAPVF